MVIEGFVKKSWALLIDRRGFIELRRLAGFNFAFYGQDSHRSNPNSLLALVEWRTAQAGWVAVAESTCLLWPRFPPFEPEPSPFRQH